MIKKSRLAKSFEMLEDGSDLGDLSSPCVKILLSLERKSFKIIGSNSAFASQVMLPKASILGRDFFSLVPRCIGSALRADFLAVIEDEGDCEGTVYLVQRDDPESWK